MDAASQPPVAPLPRNFAAGDLTRGIGLEWRISVCLQTRLGRPENIQVTVVGSTAVLRGRLQTPSEKWLCLQCCRHVPGVAQVVDELVVDD